MAILEELDPERNDTPATVATLLLLPDAQWSFVYDLRTVQVQSLPNQWLQNGTVERLLLPRTLTSIGEGVLSNIEGLEAVDLSHTAVRTIGSAFLQNSLCVTRIWFPPTLESLGYSFLAFTSIKRVDLSATRVTLLPQGFLFGTPVKVLLLPPSLAAIEETALSYTQVRQLDLSHTLVESLGDQVLVYSGVKEISLPRTIKTWGTFCFAGTLLRCLDLASLDNSFLPDGLCCQSSLEEIRFPSGLKGIGNCCLSGSGLELVDLSETAVEDIGDKFLMSCHRLREVRFPRTLRRAGAYLLATSPSLRVVDLRGTALESIGPSFLRVSGVESLWFPDTLKELGVRALRFTSIRDLDMSNTKIAQLEHFLVGSVHVRSLILPPTLIVLGHLSLKVLTARNPTGGGALVHLDLSTTPLKELGSCFLCGAINLRTLQVPATLERVGENFLRRTEQLQVLDLSETKLTELPSLFGLRSGLKELRLPPTLERIGDRVLQYTKLTRLDLSHTKVTRIGGDFAQGTPLEVLLCPPTRGACFPLGLMSPASRRVPFE